MFSTQHWLTLCLVIIGLINFLPALGVLSASRLSQAYGIELDSNELIILMRHRALLFGILGGYILVSAFVPEFRVSALIMAGLSMSGFMLFYWLQGDANVQLNKIFLADVVGLVVLGIAVGLHLSQKGTP